MDLVALVVIAVWVMLPAYIPNNVAVVAGGGQPIDGGRTMAGRRVLGDGKTWRGTMAGVVAGCAVALVLNALNTTGSTILGVDLPTFTPGIVLAFPVGAMVGDILASFLKRRSGRTRGRPWPVVDQLDFVVLALFLGAVVDPGWMFEVFTPLLLVVVLIVTPVLHVSTNVVAYVLDLKHEPW